MKNNRLCFAAAFLSVILTANLTGAADPVPAGWTGATERLLTALVDRTPAEVIRASLADRAAFRTLDGKESTLDSLQAAAAGADWARVLPYRGMPETLAADIAAIVAESPLHDTVKQFLTPEDELGIRQANITAMKWIAQQLKARHDQPIGVILFHKPSADSTSAGGLVVVLMAGERIGIDQYRVRQLTFGEFSPSRN